MDDDRIIDRIAKLLRIAERDPGPQGRTAESIAKKLMRRYGLDVQIHEPKHMPEKIVFIVSSRSVAWRSKLIEGVAAAYDCETNVTAREDAFSIWLTGSPTVLAKAKAHYDFLSSTVEHLTARGANSTNGQGKFHALSFAEGASSQICDRMSGRKKPDLKYDVKPVDLHDPDHPVPAERSRKTVYAEPEFKTNGPSVKGDTVHVDAASSPYWARRGWQAAQRFVRPRPYPVVFDTIESLGLPRVTEQALKVGGFPRVADLLRSPQQSLLAVRGIGHARIAGISKVLRRFGCALRPRRSPIS